MAIGPTGASPPFPTPTGGPIASFRDTRSLEDTTGFRNRESASRAGSAQAELLGDEDSDRRQFDLEQTAEQVRLLNPTAPRGSIVDISV